MIPQRNLSVLAKDGGRRIPESVLDDYCLAWFLEELAVADLRATLGFKGGTALKRCYFGDYRFSEDLDFTLIAHMSPDELKARLEPVYASVREASGIVFGFDREDRQMHDNSYTFYLRYEGPLPRARCDAAEACIPREAMRRPCRGHPRQGSPAEGALG